MPTFSSRTMTPADSGAAVAFDAVYRRMAPAVGERRLLLAVLEDGIRTAFKYAQATRGRGRRLHSEAMGWLASDDREHVFAFARICEALDLDAPRLRARVLALLRSGELLATEGVPGRR